MPQTKLRVHDLAKELGVASKAILEKCEAEGISLKNHMTVLTAGQEATIREWFSEGEHSTTVESADRVNLEKVRRPRKRKAPAGPAADASAAAAPGPPEVLVGPDVRPAEPAPPLAPEPPAPVPTIEPAPAVERPAAAATPPEPTRTVAPAATGDEPLPHIGTMVPGTAPTTRPSAPAAAAAKAPVAPAGPQNVPRPAQLTGPRVVRIEKPDLLPTPRPMARSSGVGTGARPIPPVTPPPAAGRKRPSGRSSGVDDDDEGTELRAAPRKGVNPRRSARDSFSAVGETLREWRDQDLLERRERLDQAIGRTHRAVEEKREKGAAPRPPVRPETIEIQAPIVLREFCRVTGIRFDQVAPKLMAQGIVAGLNRVIDGETAQLLAMEHGLELKIRAALSPLEALRAERARLERKHLTIRPPIVTILGHVDHGKTSLLDRIRKTKVAAGEAGGITQHIGAYRVKAADRYVTFLDTPGHAAFTAMRARGANLTDVVVLVVAADDGVMPQTIEAINHARAAKVPIVVALNKIDLPGIDVNKLYGQLSEHGLTPQAWGGETDVLHTSAVTGEGVDELLAHLAALSELLELKADATVPAYGRVIEAEMKEGEGAVVRVMVREGTLKNGAILVCGPAAGRVRAMKDDAGRRLAAAGPATPVEITGLNGLPAAGDEFFQVDSLQRAKEAAEDVARERREADLARLRKPMDLTTLLATAGEEQAPVLNLIIKADVQGSVDVLRESLLALSTDEVKTAVLHAGVGAVTEGDVVLAAASRALIVAFNLVAEPAAAKLAQEHQVQIRTYRVIYEVEADVRRALAGLLKPTERLESRGRAEVREVFNVSRVGRVAGCYVVEGLVNRNHLVRVLRDSVPVKDRASLASLRRFKDDVREVRAGLECGMRIEGFDDVKPGDVIEAYELIQEARNL